MLKRAAERSAKQAQKRVERAAKNNPFKKLGHVTESAFAAALSKALKQHGANRKGLASASIKMTAPDTGGRPFHFDHTAVSRKTIALKEGETAAPVSTYGKRKMEFARPKLHTTTSGAHIAYIERDGAAEEFNLDKELDAAMGRGGRERAPGSMQEYLEDDGKVSGNDAEKSPAPPKAPAFSFGTPEIGRTLEERIAFWDLAEKHAMGEVHTIQHRLIVELPHECSTEDRLAIMRDFTKKYADDGVPYWCVLHAPVEGKNDDRNFHAHIVLHGRPAKQIDFAADGIDDGTGKPTAKVWDFAAVTQQRDAFRKTRDRHLHRQDIPEDYRDKFVANERKRFAQIVNARMTSSNVPVRYDHRSYKAMGLDVEAMSSVKNLILKQSEKGERLVLDAGQTKRIVAREIERIARQRAEGFGEIEKVKKAIRRSAYRLTELDREARRVGRRAGLAKNASMAVRRAYANAALRYALAKEAHLKAEVALRFEVENLRRHVEATRPEPIAPLRAKIEKRLEQARRDDEAAAAKQAERLAKVGADQKGAMPRRRTQVIVQNIEKELDALADPEILGMLHHEAKIELARFEKEHARALSKSETMVGKALRAWKSVGTTTPAEVPMPAYTEAAARPPVRNPALEEEAPEKPKSHLRHYAPSAHDMINDMFNTPHARAALDMANRLSDHIKEAGKLKIKGKDTAQILREEVKAMADAFAKGPAEGELLLATGPRDRTPPRGLADAYASLRDRGRPQPAKDRDEPQAERPAPAAPGAGEAKAPPAAPKPQPEARPEAPPANAGDQPPPEEDPKEARKRKRRERDRQRRRAIVANRNRDFDRS